jgi:type IV secretion system protein VirD4
MGSILDWDITPWLFKQTAKACGHVVRGAVNALSEDNIDDTNDTEHKEIMQRIDRRLVDMKNSGFVLGDGVAKDEAEDGHIMVVGGVGSGKSSCIAIPSLLSWRKAKFVIDIKGELLENALFPCHPRVKVFSLYDSETYGYDPFHLLFFPPEQVQEAQAIAHALIPLPSQTDDPFWIQSAQSLFTGAILHFYNKKYSFIETVTAILDTRITDLLDEIYTSETETARRFVTSLMGMKEQTLASIFTVLSNHIIVFATNEQVQSGLIKEKNITPRDLEDGADIYICIPEYMLKHWKNLLTLMVSQFLRHFERRLDHKSEPILFLLDEFARLGKMEGIVDGLATLRSKKITIAIILQSLAQLDLHYGKEARQVIADTCQYKAILNVTDVESQEYFSKAVGTFDKIRVVKSQQYDSITKFKAGSSVTTMKEEKPIIKPHEFATLEQIVLLTPFGAYKVNKKPYYECEDI